MILFGKAARALVARVDALEAAVKDRDERIEALEREVVRIITESQEQKQEGLPIVSVADQEGEVWLKPNRTH